MKKSIAIVAGILAVPLLMAPKGCSVATGAGDANKATAIGACEKSIKNQLKAPSTADFSNERATKSGSSAYEVDGDVDAENSFGAKLRDSWFGHAWTRNGGDTWWCRATLIGG